MQKKGRKNGFKIGDIIKHRRKELGWTQVKLSQESFVSVGHLNNVECGLRGASEQIKEALFKVLGIKEG